MDTLLLKSMDCNLDKFYTDMKLSDVGVKVKHGSPWNGPSLFLCTDQASEQMAALHYMEGDAGLSFNMWHGADGCHGPWNDLLGARGASALQEHIMVTTLIYSSNYKAMDECYGEQLDVVKEFLIVSKGARDLVYLALFNRIVEDLGWQDQRSDPMLPAKVHEHITQCKCSWSKGRHVKSHRWFDIVVESGRIHETWSIRFLLCLVMCMHLGHFSLAKVGFMKRTIEEAGNKFKIREQAAAAVGIDAAGVESTPSAKAGMASLRAAAKNILVLATAVYADETRKRKTLILSVASEPVRRWSTHQLQNIKSGQSAGEWFSMKLRMGASMPSTTPCKCWSRQRSWKVAACCLTRS